MIKTELCTKKKRLEVASAEVVMSSGMERMLARVEAKAIEKAIEKCKINCPVNGEVVLISDLKKYASKLGGVSDE